jgi:hypothetical protein
MRNIIALLLLTGALAGCATGGSLSAAADRLDNSAHQFSRELYASPAPSDAATDAARLADAARNFNRDVDRNASHDRLQSSFGYVAERYHELRSELEGRRYYSAYGFERVTDAYLDVDRVMNDRRGRYGY